MTLYIRNFYGSCHRGDHNAAVLVVVTSIYPRQKWNVHDVKPQKQMVDDVHGAPANTPICAGNIRNSRKGSKLKKTKTIPNRDLDYTPRNVYLQAPGSLTAVPPMTASLLTMYYDVNGQTILTYYVTAEIGYASMGKAPNPV